MIRAYLLCLSCAIALRVSEEESAELEHGVEEKAMAQMLASEMLASMENSKSFQQLYQLLFSKSNMSDHNTMVALRRAVVGHRKLTDNEKAHARKILSEHFAEHEDSASTRSLLDGEPSASEVSTLELNSEEISSLPHETVHDLTDDGEPSTPMSAMERHRIAALRAKERATPEETTPVTPLGGIFGRSYEQAVQDWTGEMTPEQSRRNDDKIFGGKGTFDWRLDCGPAFFAEFGMGLSLALMRVVKKTVNDNWGSQAKLMYNIMALFGELFLSVQGFFDSMSHCARRYLLHPQCYAGKMDALSRFAGVGSHIARIAHCRGASTNTDLLDEQGEACIAQFSKGVLKLIISLNHMRYLTAHGYKNSPVIMSKNGPAKSGCVDWTATLITFFADVTDSVVNLIAGSMHCFTDNKMDCGIFDTMLIGAKSAGWVSGSYKNSKNCERMRYQGHISKAQICNRKLEYNTDGTKNNLAGFNSLPFPAYGVESFFGWAQNKFGYQDEHIGVDQRDLDELEETAELFPSRNRESVNFISALGKMRHEDELNGGQGGRYHLKGGRDPLKADEMGGQQDVGVVYDRSSVRRDEGIHFENLMKAD